ncbi:MAG: arylsulfatase [Methylococcaceae bacterium]|nr:arylsulfatase [Methylococcaceae bacterium]
MSIKSSFGISLAVIFTFSGILRPALASPDPGKRDHRPNIVFLVVDDMGYSDLPLFGGEVDTPNIDKLAAGGITFNNFHALPSCSPTRSVLLSGVDNHLNGLGTMPERLSAQGARDQRGQPGYLAYLNDRVVTGPELLREAGYHTYMAGKWHLAADAEDGGFRRGTWPIDRGFERSTGVLEGGSEQFGGPQIGPEMFHYFEDDHVLTQGFPPPNFYTTKNYTQKIIDYIESNKRDGKPFFVYWAPNVPHWPHQAPQEFIDKYVKLGTYEQGWDALREQRFNRMMQLGIIPAAMNLPPRAPNVPAWDNPTDPAWNTLLNAVKPYQDIWGIQDVAGLKRTLAKDMAVYTGMIDYIDVEIGNLIGYLKNIDEYKNTVFVFLSDNGGDAANLAFRRDMQDSFRLTGVDNRLENVGGPHSLVSYAPGWAQVSNTPLYSAKLAVGDAGIRVPLIITYPGARNIRGHRRSNALVTVQDILPTVLRYAGVRHPAGTHIPPDVRHCTVQYKNRTICPMNGKSMVGLLAGQVDQLYGNHTPIGFELFGTVNKALIRGPWKILRLGDAPWGVGQKQPWKLFNLSSDPTELDDLSAKYPNRLKNMMSEYGSYEKQVGFIPFISTQRPIPSETDTEDFLPEIDFRHVMD